MGVRIDGSNDVVSAADGSLTVDGLSLSVTGIITASGGFKVGSAYTAYSNGNVETTGIVTTSGGLNVTDGNVGIGTNIAGTLLELNGKSSKEATVTFNRQPVQGTNDGTIGQFIFENNTDSVALLAVKRQSAADDAYMQFATQGTGGGLTERLRINSSGQVLIGATSAEASHGDRVQINSTTGVAVHRGAASAAGPRVDLTKSRNATHGSNTIVQSGDLLGSIFFRGDDGTDYNSSGAQILCQVDGTPGANDMPGRLVFSTTADGASSPTERLRITAGGGFHFSNGELIEQANVTAGKLSDNTNIDLENGMVHLFTTQETTTSTPNIRINSSTSLNSVMAIGETISVTLITTAAAAAYSAQLTIDGGAVTENWTGGSAPSDGGSSGVDIHAYTIIKTADATFTVIATQTKTS